MGKTNEKRKPKDGNSDVMQQYLGQALHGRPVDGQQLTPQQVSELVAKHRHPSTSGPTEAGGGQTSMATDPRLSLFIRDAPENLLNSRVSSVMPVTRQVHSTKADSPVLQWKDGRSSVNVRHSNDNSNTGVKQSRRVKDKAVQPPLVHAHHEEEDPGSPGSAQFSPHNSPRTPPALGKPARGPQVFSRQEPDRGPTLPPYHNYHYQEYGPPLQWPPQMYCGAPGFNGPTWQSLANLQGSVPFGHSVHSLAPPHAVPYDPAGGQPRRLEDHQTFQPVLPVAHQGMGGPSGSSVHSGKDVDPTQPDVSRAAICFKKYLNIISIFMVIVSD